MKRALHRSFFIVMKCLPPSVNRRLWYVIRHRRLGNFRSPTRFSEKVNWRILHDRRRLIADTCDKLTVKTIAERHGVMTPRTYWTGTDVRELIGVQLPEHWVLKPNHRSGLFYFGHGSHPDVDHISRCTHGWLAEHIHVDVYKEWAYTQARSVLLVEEMLGDGQTVPDDYRFFTFAGKVACIQVECGTYTVHTRRFYTPEWEPLDVQQGFPIARAMPRPAALDDMLKVAQKVGAGYDFIRIDLYDIDGAVYLGELTPYPIGGLGRYRPSQFDVELGALWELPSREDVL